MHEGFDPRLALEISKGIPLVDLEQRLRPGNSSQVGFLGTQENLLEVIHSDLEVVKSSGTTPEEIAEALKRAMTGENVTAPGFVYKTQQEISLIEIERLGEQECPWLCPSQRGKTMGILAREDVIENRLVEIRCAVADVGFDEIRLPDAPNQYTIVTGLLPHLIRGHYFFEGIQSPYRADPALLVQAFGLRK